MRKLLLLLIVAGLGATICVMWQLASPNRCQQFAEDLCGQGQHCELQAVQALLKSAGTDADACAAATTKLFQDFPSRIRENHHWAVESFLLSELSGSRSIAQDQATAGYKILWKNGAALPSPYRQLLDTSLPESPWGDAIKLTLPVVLVRASGIWLHGKQVISTKDFHVEDRELSSGGFRIDPLGNAWEKSMVDKAYWAAFPPVFKFAKLVLIGPNNTVSSHYPTLVAADPEMPFSLLSRIAYTIAVGGTIDSVILATRDNSVNPEISGLKYSLPSFGGSGNAPILKLSSKAGYVIELRTSTEIEPRTLKVTLRGGKFDIQGFQRMVTDLSSTPLIEGPVFIGATPEVKIREIVRATDVLIRVAREHDQVPPILVLNPSL